jgi:hypothetical protein
MPFIVDPQRVRDVLQEWASESEQRRLWLSDGANGSEISSFIEAREGLFTDTGLGSELDKRRTVFNVQADALLVELDTVLSKIDAYRRPNEIIADDKMEAVRVLADRLLHLIPTQ